MKAKKQRERETDPVTYLSHSEGMWRLIQSGSPLCKDSPDRAQAEACARHYKIELPNVIWDGDKGAFVDEP